jgi:hypothetical protein
MRVGFCRRDDIRRRALGFLRSSGADHGNSVTNWSAAERRMLGIKVGSFGILVYARDSDRLGGKDLLNIDLSGLL